MMIAYHKRRPVVYLLVILICFFLSTAVAVVPIKVLPCPPSLPTTGARWSIRTDMTQLLNAFKLDSGSGPAPYQTNISLCHQPSQHRLLVHFEAEDAELLNPLRSCNENLYEWDVVEMFLTYTATNLHNYLELELNPFNTSFQAHVSNPNLDCPGIQDRMIPCAASGIAFSSAKVPDFGWFAQASIPLPADQPVLKANFFRVDHTTGQSTVYSAWQPTMATPACFHRPHYFQAFQFV